MHTAEHSHCPDAIAERISAGPDSTYVKEWVYGGIDGVVTTFAVVAAVIGANFSPIIVLFMGLANLIGDGFSMAASSYSGAKAENDNYERLRQIEENHIEKYPEGEMEETRQIFASKGFEGKDLDSVVDVVVKDKELWIDIMMSEEYGVSRSSHAPINVAIHTFSSFFVCGSMPLIPYILPIGNKPWVSLALAALTFFCIGSIKSRWSVNPWWREGFSTMFIGLTAASFTYGIGYLLKMYIV